MWERLVSDPLKSRMSAGCVYEKIEWKSVTFSSALIAPRSWNDCLKWKQKRMIQTYMLLLILMTLSSLSCAENKTEVTVSCPEHRNAFGASCYEFVGLRRSFSGAQAWCERHGGHLVFIRDEGTQYFLQRHSDPKKDLWFGAASSASTNLQYPPTAGGKTSQTKIYSYADTHN